MKGKGILFVVMSLVLLSQGPAAEPPAPDTRFRDKLIADVIKRLESEKFDERQQATDLLRSLGRPTIEPLKQLLATNPNLEVATRARQLLRVLTKETPRRELRERLSRPIVLPQGIAPNTPLKDVLDFLQEKHGLPLVLINEDALRAIEIQKPDEQPVTLLPMKGVRLSTVLPLLLSQLKGAGSVATYVVRGDHLEITSTKQMRPREWTGEMRDLLVPRVQLEFDGETLEEALREVSDSIGVNVVLDGREADKGKKPVKLTLNEVPADTALRLLADMAGLRPVVMDNVFYITSAKNALDIEAEMKKDDLPFGSPLAPIRADESKGELKDK
jgi:hypothetical protein